MTYNDMLNLVLALPFDTMKEVYSNGKQSLLIYRPSTLSKRFKNYDINTNFQIFLKIGDDKPFKPNHLRLLMVNSNPRIPFVTQDSLFVNENPVL